MLANLEKGLTLSHCLDPILRIIKPQKYWNYSQGNDKKLITKLLGADNLVRRTNQYNIWSVSLICLLEIEIMEKHISKEKIIKLQNLKDIQRGPN